MENKYKEWTEAYLARCAVPEGIGTCREATEEMAAAFPELIRHRGFVMTMAAVERQHWWLTTPTGDIVDPTAAQFKQYGGPLYYEEYNPDIHGPEPIGKCMNCGNPCFEDSPSGVVCSDRCDAELVAWLG